MKIVEEKLVEDSLGKYGFTEVKMNLLELHQIYFQQIFTDLYLKTPMKLDIQPC